MAKRKKKQNILNETQNALTFPGASGHKENAGETYYNDQNVHTYFDGGNAGGSNAGTSPAGGLGTRVIWRNSHLKKRF